MDKKTMLQPRDVVTTKRVLDTFEVPVINFEQGLTAEVTKFGQGEVYLGGVLLKGVTSHGFHEVVRGCYPKVVMKLCTPAGDQFTLTVNKVLVTEGHIPSTATLIKTDDQAT